MYAYLRLTGATFTAQALLFAPIVPLLLEAGALAGRGQLHLGWTIAAAAAGIAGGDVVVIDRTVVRNGRQESTTGGNRLCRPIYWKPGL
jgi:hypothetical protein